MLDSFKTRTSQEQQMSHPPIGDVSKLNGYSSLNSLKLLDPTSGLRHLSRPASTSTLTEVISSVEADEVEEGGRTGRVIESRERLLKVQLSLAVPCGREREFLCHGGSVEGCHMCQLSATLCCACVAENRTDRKSTRLNSSHL